MVAADARDKLSGTERRSEHRESDQKTGTADPKEFAEISSLGLGAPCEMVLNR